MAKRYGISYMGSKEGVLHLIKYILEREYKKEYFIDLFCGGLAVSNYALQESHFKVIANDLNHYVIALYNAIINKNKDFEERKYEWVSREQFEDVRDNPDKYEDWWVGFVSIIWSFGNRGATYMYGKDIEDDKQAVHQALVFNDFSFYDNNFITKKYLISKKTRAIDYKTNNDKKNKFTNEIKQQINFNNNIGRFEKDINISMINANLNRLENLERLERLENLESINNLNKIVLTSKDWLKCYNSISKEVLEKAVIYCDPPYENTAKYSVGKDFDYKEFWQWFRDCPYSVYVSSYKAPKDIELLNFDNKIVILSALTEKRTIKKENIYWNGKGNYEPTGYDLLFNIKKR